MKKYLKIIIILSIVAGAAFGLSYLSKPQSADVDLQKMKDSIAAEPVVNNNQLTAEQITQRLEQFRKVRQEILSADFDTLQGVNELALLKQQLGDLEGARIAWEYANIIRPRNSLSFSNVAALYHFDLKEYGKAEKNYLISIANDPDDIPTIRNFFELYYYAMKDMARAEALLLKSIEANQGLGDLYSLTGGFYRDIGQIPKAIEYFKKSLELNPGSEAVKKEIARLEALPK